MPLKLFLTCVIVCWSAPTHAQSCVQLYNAIKKAAMYCAFDCDQQTIEPLQVAYERQCIVAVVPLSIFPDDPRPDQSSAPSAGNRIESSRNFASY